MKSNFKLMFLIFLTLLLFLNGCAIKNNYVWNEYPIASERISQKSNFIEGKEIRIIKGTSDESKKIFGWIGTYMYWGNEQSLTNGIVDQLTNEMKNKQLEIKNTTEKSLEITVNGSSFIPGRRMNAVILEFSVKFGNGKIKLYGVRNSAPTFGRVNSIFHRTYNGVVSLAVIDIINDPEVVAYINE